jgi:hypothetical protein
VRAGGRASSVATLLETPCKPPRPPAGGGLSGGSSEVSQLPCRVGDRTALVATAAATASASCGPGGRGGGPTALV